MTHYLDIENRKEFLYPESFIETINKSPEIDLEPWWFIVFENGDVNYWHHTLKKLYPQRDLIPFAKFNANDDIACFDGSDTSDNPQIFIIHAYATEGWELHAVYKNFSEWLNTALKTHKLWETEE